MPVASGARCLRLLWIESPWVGHRARTGRISKRDNPIHRTQFRRWIRHCADQSVQQLGAGQGRRVQHDDSDPQPLSAAQQARSLMEYRQAELRLAQLYTQIRMQVVNAQFALTNDRAEVQSSLAARDYAEQSLDAEQKKLHLGASTTASCAAAGAQSCHGREQPDRSECGVCQGSRGLYQTLATTLQHYGINLQDAAKGTVNTAPTIQGVQPASTTPQPTTTPMPEQPTAPPPSR